MHTVERRRKLKSAVLQKAAASIVRLYEKISRRKFESVLILGHMRSGSTLLSHILISHQDLIGYGERNRYYESIDDLALLRFQAQHNRRQWRHFPRYAVDQINHNRFTPNPAILRTPQARCIFLIREPLASVSSLLRVLAPRYGFGLEYAVSYYIERLAGLTRLTAMTDPDRTAFLTYADLLHRTKPTLAGMARFLDLQVELGEEYQTFDFTGQRGDPGGKIRLARISRDTPDPMDFPETVVESLEAAYADSLNALSERHRRLSDI